MPRLKSSTAKKAGTRGQGLVEYIVLVCLIAVIVFTVVKQMGTTTKAKYTEANNLINQL